MLALIALLTVALYGAPAAVASDNLVSWGDDFFEQVSDTPTGSGFTAVAAGASHSVALGSDGSLTSWGDNRFGQVSRTPTGTGFTAVAAGNYDGVALRSDGSLVSWGDNRFGQVSKTPTGSGFTAVAAGGYYSVALRSDGSLVSWGDNGYGQVSGTPTGTGFTAVAAGDFHGVALRSDGSLVSWGNNGFGQVSKTPTGSGFTAVAAGGYYSAALRSDGSLVSWGDNRFGQVSRTPTGTGFTAVAAGFGYGVALRSDGSLVSWGYSHFGQVSGTPTGTGFTAVAAGDYHGVAVRVPDVTPPVVSVPADMTVDATSPAGAQVTFTASASDEVDGALTPTCTPESGSVFAIGTTRVSCSAADAAGNTGSASLSVTVRDVTPPVVSVPADMTVDATSPAGAQVTFTASASDEVDGALTPTCTPESGSVFAIGTTRVSCSAADAAGNTGSASLSVTVRDVTPPVVSVPADMTVDATSPAGAQVTFTASASDEVDGALTPTCTPESGSVFAIGTTRVSCSAADAAGNTGSASLSVTVRDVTPPVVSVPADMTVDATSPAGAQVTFTASASDEVDGALTPTCTPESGSVFAIGTTRVSCSAADAAGNTGSASLSVTVRGAAEQIANEIARVEGSSLPTGASESLTGMLNAAAIALDAGDPQAAVRALDAALRYIEAQSGVAIRTETAQTLTDDITRIPAVIGG